ncbi:Jag protein [Fusobacterium necrophorum subsp. funduliforme]|uniref:R3H domain protein n=5 Tax=Fusobacterium necrophorum TaxID=859 RepID=A0AAN3VWE9_9FUSO|nr:RNA-binding cell elongation regulator Jag/EloR [Fusobacterium necrophorum]AYV94018.1 KH domain-containing protein [Fusobacterium necrophorum subsp. funduliforme]AYV96185.1 KH domain-containing protein [Fusobacterium necrophorum subsp. funduliforme]EFS22620.1 R3H domain protein [Fusobacterium necrophorum D12]EIJ69537.1 R3H domain protein [Fusobacterium necrophorum subsp. funduliforme ATCC 51357]EJU18253.1 R3H domain protein [Fusobacterium necrophorum subsp. funduliforme Fnf 1007]
MIKNTQIKAMTEEEAKKRALNILEAKEYQIVDIKILENPKSFLGLFNKNGLFEIIIDTEKQEKAVPKILMETKKTKKITEESKKNSFSEEEIISNIKTLLENIGLNLRLEYKKISEKHYHIQLFGEDNGIIIGKKGKTLNSFEYLINSIYKDYKIEIDVEGFKEKRNKTLRELGRKMAEKCIKNRKIIRLNPMPPKERKIIHEILNKYSELETYSEGRDPKRYIVIKYKKK